MPEIVVYAVGNRSQDEKRALCKDITAAMVKNYKFRLRPSSLRWWKRREPTKPRVE